MPSHRVHILSDALASGRSAALRQRLQMQAMQLGLDLACTPSDRIDAIDPPADQSAAAADAIIVHLQGQPLPLAAIAACRLAVLVSEPALEQAARPLVDANAHLIHGRGDKGFKWALRFIAAQLAHRCVKFSYGAEPDQSAWLTVPPAGARGAARRPVAVLAHGGFWQDRVALDHMAPLAAALAERGWMVCNLEFRRQLRWNDSCQDILCALERLPASAAGFAADLSRVVVIGHSSGAYLLHGALVQGKTQLDRCGIRVRMMVGLAGLFDIAAAAAAGLGDGAVDAIVRNSGADHPLPDPLRQDPETPMLLVHGLADRTVPPVQSQSYLARRSSNRGGVRLMLVDGLDHMDLLKPDRAHWRDIETQMSEAVRQREELIA